MLLTTTLLRSLLAFHAVEERDLIGLAALLPERARVLSTSARVAAGRGGTNLAAAAAPPT